MSGKDFKIEHKENFEGKNCLLKQCSDGQFVVRFHNTEVLRINTGYFKPKQLSIGELRKQFETNILDKLKSNPHEVRINVMWESYQICARVNNLIKDGK